MKDTENERIVFCHSSGREDKERAILSQAEQRFLEDLSKLQNRIDKGRLKNFQRINQSLGRLQERHHRVNRYYEVAYTSDGLIWTRNDDAIDTAANLLGCYYLRSSVRNMKGEDIWRLYMMLTRVEAAFRTLKSDLGLRPIFHRKEDRCDSHIFITVLAYHLLHWIEYNLRQHGDTRKWSTVRRTLQTHAYTTIVCPDKKGNIHWIRAPGTPDSEQQKIYSHLRVEWRKAPRVHTITSAAK